MRIAIIVQNFPPHMVGGTERQAEQLAERLSIIHDVVIYTKHYPNQRLIEKRKEFLIKRVKFLDSKIHVLNYLSFSKNCYKEIVHDKKPDIILSMMLVPSGFIGCLVKRKLDVPVITWIRGGDWYFVKNYFLGRMAIKFVTDRSDLVLAQTEIIRQEVKREYKPRRIEVIANGITLSDKFASGNSVVFIGNLNKRKGTEYLIYAMKNLPYQCLVIGDGKERRNLEQIAGPNVKFLGKKSPEEIEKFLQSAAVLVLPAVAGEGLPNVILEAMNYGVPVIATRIAGIPDVITHEKTGFVVKTHDPNEIEFYIKKIMKDPKLRKQISDNEKQEIKKYEWSNITSELEKWFKILKPNQ